MFQIGLLLVSSLPKLPKFLSILLLFKLKSDKRASHIHINTFSSVSAPNFENSGHRSIQSIAHRQLLKCRENPCKCTFYFPIRFEYQPQCFALTAMVRQGNLNFAEIANCLYCSHFKRLTPFFTGYSFQAAHSKEARSQSMSSSTPACASPPPDASGLPGGLGVGVTSRICEGTGEGTETAGSTLVGACTISDIRERALLKA